jgi:uncharacterized protein YkwD
VSATLASAAAAAPLSLQVVNERGTEQASIVSAPAGNYGTDGYGRLTLEASPGEVLAVTRGAAAPEGPGLAYTVPDPVPTAPVTITLEALPGAVTPAIDAAEAWLLDGVNAERAALGRAPLTLSSTLTRAADAYAHYLAEAGQFSHTALATPGVRAVDQGWPVPGGSAVGEALALAPSRELALQGWKGSLPHWTLLMMDGLDSVGVGQAGGRWVMMPADCGIAAAPERCGLGADPAVTPPGTTDRPPPPAAPAPRRDAARREPRLALSLTRRGRRLLIRVRVAEGRGRLRVAVRRGRRSAKLRHRRSGELHRYVARLGRRGRWTVAVRFDGAAGWADARLRKRVVRVR